jgi:DNA-directed RNA polymerase specialized sigma subunit
VLEREEVLSRLAQRMAKLPEMQKKVLAMYYYENVKLSEIAAYLGLTESRICQIHTQTVGVLRKHGQHVGLDSCTEQIMETKVKWDQLVGLSGDN